MLFSHLISVHGWQLITWFYIGGLLLPIDMHMLQTVTRQFIRPWWCTPLCTAQISDTVNLENVQKCTPRWRLMDLNTIGQTFHALGTWVWYCYVSTKNQHENKYVSDGSEMTTGQFLVQYVWADARPKLDLWSNFDYRIKNYGKKTNNNDGKKTDIGLVYSHEGFNGHMNVFEMSIVSYWLE